jgi:hypothetical protein
MQNRLNLNPELLQAAIDLDTSTPIETVIEAAVREYIDRCNGLKAEEARSFGDSILAFRAKHNLSQMDLNPDEIWAGVRNTSFMGREVSFE